VAVPVTSNQSPFLYMRRLQSRLCLAASWLSRMCLQTQVRYWLAFNPSCVMFAYKMHIGNDVTDTWHNERAKDLAFTPPCGMLACNKQMGLADTGP